MKSLSLLFIIMLFVVSSSYAFDTPIRIKCQPNDQGAKVYINGENKGECSSDGPLNIFLYAGPTTVFVHKQVDRDHEQVYQHQFTAVAGVPKILKVVLSSPQLTEKARLAKERADKMARLAKEKADFERALAAANNGELEAMATLAQYYQRGTGVAQDSSKAEAWLWKIEEIKANNELSTAKSGDLKAMEAMVQRYKHGKGVKRNIPQAQEWQAKVDAAKKLAKAQQEAQARREAAARKKAQLEKELAQASFLQNTEKFFRSENPGDIFEVLTLVAMSPISMATDLISCPTRLMERNEIKKRLAAHPAAWAKPNSMMAKAYRSQQHKTGFAPLIAAR